LQRFTRFRPSSVVGLDIRAHEVRLIVLRQAKRLPLVEHMTIIDLPFGAFKEGKIQSLDQVIEPIRLEVLRLKIENRPAAIALPMQSVISRPIQLMKTVSHEMREKIIAENLAHYFPEVTHELCYDYVMLPDADELHVTALLVATRQDQLNDYMTVIERAGLSAKIIDVDMYALVRALKTAIAAQERSSFSAVVELELDTAQFIIFNLNEILFHRQFDYRTRQELYSQLNSIVHLSCSTHHTVKLDKIYFTGHTENVLPLREKMQEQLGIRIQCIDLSQSVRFSSSIGIEKMRDFSEKMMVSMGLAIRRMPRW
jgi:type IV pilus assembly protein PilM